MSTNRAVLWLRVCYWLGAIIDGLFAVVMVLPPQVGGKLFGIADFHPGPDYRYAMFVAAALMAGCRLISCPVVQLSSYSDVRPQSATGGGACATR